MRNEKLLPAVDKGLRWTALDTAGAPEIPKVIVVAVAIAIAARATGTISPTWAVLCGDCRCCC
jgi:hypothetical protein